MKMLFILQFLCMSFLTALSLPGGREENLVPEAYQTETGTHTDADTATSAAENDGLENLKNGLEALSGLWVDVNSDTALRIEGSRLTLSFGNWTEEYGITVTKDDYNKYITCTDSEWGFGLMSDLEICEDGSLRAYEQILDGSGHTYRFVREEDLAGELEFQDLSRDLPKEILSTEIEEFSLSFSVNVCGAYGLDEKWIPGRYSWELEKQEDGSFRMFFQIMGDSYIALDFDKEVRADYAEGLDLLLKEMQLPALNGYYVKNNVNKPGYSLYVDYASGERLRIMASGDPSDTCVFDLPKLLDYAAEQDLFSAMY